MNLKTGDILFVKSYMGLVDHVGIVVIEDNQNFIYHNTPYFINEFGGSICVDKLSSWIENRKIVKVIESGISLEKIKEASFNLREEKYNLIYFNCEHYISNIIEGNRKSNQLLTWVIGLGLLGIVVKGA